jgi:putative redox protein
MLLSLADKNWIFETYRKTINMPKHEIETQWMGEMQFNALINEHTIVMDAPQKSGGEDNGPIPKPLVLAALSGCTGMDIIALLRNAGEHIDDLDMKVTGELSKQAPLQYVSIHIQYIFRAEAKTKEAVLNAVTASQEKHCGVSSMLKKALPVTWEIIFNGESIFNNQYAENMNATV